MAKTPQKHLVIDGITLNVDGSIYKCDKWPKENIKQELMGLEAWLRHSPLNRHLEGYANKRGFNFRSFLEALKKHKDLTDYYEFCKQICKDNYLQQAENGALNTSIAKMVLISNFGMTSENSTSSLDLQNPFVSFFQQTQVDMSEDVKRNE